MAQPILKIKCEAVSIAVVCQLLLTFISMVIEEQDEDDFEMEFDCINDFLVSVEKAINSIEQGDLQEKIIQHEMLKQMKDILNNKKG
jgi:hypothetical protein